MPHSLADQCRDKPKNRHFETKLNRTTFPSSLYQVWLPLIRLTPHGQASAPLQVTSEPRTAWLQDKIFGTALTLVPGEGTGGEPRSQVLPEWSSFPWFRGEHLSYGTQHLQPVRWLTHALLSILGSVMQIKERYPRN